MRKKFTLLISSLLICVAATAQGWVKPAAPASTPLAADTECFLYNTGVEGFYLGANEWNTRASYSTTRGYKVHVRQDTREGAFDGSSYLIECYIEDGWNAGNSLFLYLKDNISDGIWVDEAIDGASDKSFVFEDNGDGTFKIGLSSKNKTYNGTEGYEGTYLGAKSDLTDTRLYLIDIYETSDAHLNWYFVSPENYTTYVSARKIYDAAVVLGSLIEEAEGLNGVDATVLGSAKTTYGDHSSSEATLKSESEKLKDAIQKAKEANASLDNQVEMLAIRGFGTDFTDGEVRGWTSTTSAANKQASNGNNAADYSVTGNHYENWSGSPFEPGVISVTPTELPEGVYRLNALAYASVTGGTYLFAGDAQTPVTTTNIDIANPLEVVTYVSEGSVKVGMEIKEKGPNWVGLDNVGLFYLGAEAEALSYLKTKTLEAEPEFQDLCQKSVAETYDSSKETFQNASDKESMAVAYPAYMAALKAKIASCDAYQQFYTKYLEVETFIDDHGASYAGEQMDLLVDYLEADDIEPNEIYPNGSAAYFLMNGTLDAETILKEIEFMTELRNNALANSMEDGDDVTDLIKNPHFAEEGMWTKVGLPEWPIGPDDYKLGQAYSILFNVYQDLEGIQNGLYELTLNDLYRPANYDSSDYEHFRAYVYLNSDEAKLNSIESGATTEQGHSSDYTLIDGTFVPNGVEGAAEAFKAGRYQQKLYGIVTDGKLRVGIRNDVRFEGCWGVWSDFRLKFRAKNVEVTKEVLNATLPNANELLASKCGQEEINSLQSAIADAQTAGDDAVYNALVDLKNAMSGVTACTETYASLSLAINNLKDAIDQNGSSSKIDEARTLLNEAQTAYDNGSWNNATAEEKITALAEITVALKLGDMSDEEKDVTNLIVNPDFDPLKGSKADGTIEGWVTTAMNGYKEHSVSYNRAPFHLYQDLKGLPKGKYKVTVHTYYRAGYYNEEAQRIAHGEETHLTQLYAETSTGKESTPVKNLIDDADTDDFGVKCYTYDDSRHAPDGTTPTVAWFAKGKYLNELVFTVPEDGNVRIGLKKDETFENDYEVVGTWTLTFLGDNDRTNLIVNPDFDPLKGSKADGTIEGWVTTAMNGYKEHSVSYNRVPFHLYQDLKGLPKGIYEVTVHTYYRAGYYDEEAQRIANGEETHLTQLYAETSTGKESTPVKNLIDDADTDDFGVKCYTYNDGRHAPDGTTPTVAWFAKGKYLNSLRFEVSEDGNVRIGLKKDETFDNDYEVVGAWNLYYIGKSSDTSVEGDVNGDKRVDISDVVAIINAIAKDTYSSAADIDGDKKINISDVVKVINIIASK